MAAEKVQMSGVIIKASPVEISTPYFANHYRNVSKLDALSIVTGNGIFFRENERWWLQKLIWMRASLCL